MAWISRVHFCEKYEINRNRLDVFVHNGRIPDVHTTKKDINEDYLLKIQDFKRKVQFRNQELYYLLSEHFKNIEISRVCVNGGLTSESISDYLRYNVFMVEECNILNTRISRTALACYRYWWKIERRLRRRGASIAKILDNRMGNV
jgi:hypothetical protein